MTDAGTEPEIMIHPLFVAKGTMYRVDRSVYEQGAGVVLVFYDADDVGLWRRDPAKWASPYPKPNSPPEDVPQ